jgi:hypothetical protein
MDQENRDADNTSSFNALSALQAELQLVTQALYALHLQATHLQGMLCAAIDTHPDPALLKVFFERQMAHTVLQVSPQNLDAFNVQTLAWLTRIEERTHTLALVKSDDGVEMHETSRVH